MLGNGVQASLIGIRSELEGFGAGVDKHLRGELPIDHFITRT